MVTELKVVSVERVSTNSDGEGANGPNQLPSLSADGTKFAFESFATNLVPEKSDPTRADVFVKNLITGEIVLASANAQGEATFAVSPSISPDGSQVAFNTSSAEYGDNDTNGTSDVILKDLDTGESMIVSTDLYGNVGNARSQDAVFSPDGRYVAFTSLASNLVPGDTNFRTDLFLKDLQTGDIKRVSTGPNGEQLNGGTYDAVFSPDGTKIAIATPASNISPNDDNGHWDVYLKDLVTGALTLVSADVDGNVGNGESSPTAISADGTKVLFWSGSSDLVPGDTNDFGDVFMKDLTTGELVRLSVGAFGAEADNGGSNGIFTPDETGVVFTSSSTNLVANDENNASDIFLKNLETGAITLLSQLPSGEQPNDFSDEMIFLPGGMRFLFRSDADNWVADDTNADTDMFVATLQEFDARGLIQWAVEDGGNGHWYEYVEEPTLWHEAKADAEGRSFMRMPGYLATITSPEENAFINSITDPNVWAGGSDEEVEGTWRWVGGPEAGEVFWTEAQGTVTYADWGGEEPNNVSPPAGEDYLLAHALYPDGSWADAGVPPNPNGTFGYVVEYSDPTPLVAEISVGRTEAETLDIQTGFGVKTNPHASVGAYLQAFDEGEQRAYGRFSGDDGFYTITVGYFDETDGVSTLAVEVNGEVIDRWVWDEDPAGNIVTADAAAKRLLSFVELEEGDIITLSGTADGREPLRTDYIDIREAPPIGSFLVEAETLEIIKDFQIITNYVASGDAYLQAGGGPEQIARYDFDGAAGTYDFHVGYYDETDGVSHMSIVLNGEEVDDWYWDGDDGAKIANYYSKAEHLVGTFELSPGDVIELVGEPNGGEPLRTDYIRFQAFFTDPVVDEFLLI